MGLLTESEQVFTWEETKAHADHVRKHGILQFIRLYNKLRDRKNDELKWGDEVNIATVFILIQIEQRAPRIINFTVQIEYVVVKLDREGKQAKLLLKGESMLKALQEKEKTSPEYVT